MKITKVVMISILAAILVLHGFGCSKEKSVPASDSAATSVPEPNQATTPEPIQTPAPTDLGDNGALETEEG